MSEHLDDEPPLDLMALSAIASALVAAHGTGLLGALTRGPHTTEALASELGLHPRGCERVLSLLAAHQIAARTASGWRAGPQLTALLEGPMGNLDRAHGLWSHVPEFLRSGAPYFRSDGEAEHRQAVYAGVVSGLGRMFEPSARKLALALGERLPSDEPIEVLDVGAGSAVWSLAYAQSNPNVQVTALDLPDVLPNARARAESLGVADRLTPLEGDYHEAELEAERYGCVVLANVLHLETAGSAESLVRRAATWLRPRGALVIVDAFCDGSARSEIAWSSYALHLAMRTTQGFPHRRETIAGWLSQAGVGAEELVDLAVGNSAVGALIARREA